MRIDNPATCPKPSATIPINGVIKAPPDTPMIIRADISFARSGLC